MGAVELDLRVLSGPPLSILVVHEELPTYDRQSGSLRLQRYIELMVAAGHRVTFLARAGFDQERYVAELQAIGVEVHAVDAQRLRALGYRVPGLGIDIRTFLHRGRFDIAYLNFYGTAEQYVPDLRAHSPGTRILIDTHDVHYLRERRGAELSGDAAALAEAERTRQREAAIYAQADLLTAVSVDDANALRELAPEVPVEIVTNVHLEAEPGPGFDQRNGFVFVANFDHAPNVDAILDFHRSSWPRIAAALPDARLLIVGFAPPPAVQSLAGGQVIVTGQVPAVQPYLDEARVSIAPLRYGAGVKGKIGEALMHGLPVVTTTIGAEGMGLVDGEHVLIAEAGDEFARAAVRLHGDAELWQRISHRGREHVQGRHSVQAAAESLDRALASARPGPFIADTAPWSDAAVAEVVVAYVSAFAETDPVTLIVPVTPEDPDPQAVITTLVQAITNAGGDPERIPDLAVMPCLAIPPVPTQGVLVSASRSGPPASTLRIGAPRVLQLPAGRDEWVAARLDAPAPPAAQPRASVIIPAYGRREMTERCLAALEADIGGRLGGEYELILVDNRSPDDTLELFEQWRDRATILELEANRNFAGGVNAGAAQARGDVLVVVSTDMELAPGTIDALVDEALLDQVGLVGARMTYPDGRIQHGGIGWRPVSHGMLPFHLFHYEPGDLLQARGRFDLGTVTGGCIAVRADLFRLVGGFDEGYVNGWEDSDLCLAVRAAGARVRYVGNVDIVHHEGGTSGASYNGDHNPQRFIGRWGAGITDDRRRLALLFGAMISPIIDDPVPADRSGGAALRVVGPLSGIGPRAAEARGLLRALGEAGLPAAARTVAPSWIGPALDEAGWKALGEAHARPADPGAVDIVFGDAPTGALRPRFVRLGAPIVAPAVGLTALASCPAVADDLQRHGWDPEAVVCLPPLGLERRFGEGGEGILVVLPTHDPALTAAILAGLPALEGLEVQVSATVATPELRAMVVAALPSAEVLQPVTSERTIADVARRVDVVVALDPGDEFDRTALTAAGAGAAVLVRHGGPAQWVLGDLAPAVDPANPEAVSAAVAATRSLSIDLAARRTRAATVEDRCGAAAVHALRQATTG